MKKNRYIFFLLLLAMAAATDTYGQQMAGQPIRPAAVTRINFMELSRMQAAMSDIRNGEGTVDIPFLTLQEEDGGSRIVPPAGNTAQTTERAMLAPSQPPVQTYQALPDSQAVGSAFSYIPPDTWGAVGIDKVMVTLNNNVRIIDKASGTPISTVSLNNFWASTGATGMFDPKVVYDPYNNRWIFVACSNSRSSSSSLCVGISQTSDPSGSWTLTRYIIGTATLWADFPCLGFNKNWIACSVNMFTIATDAFSSGTLLIIDYPNSLAGMPVSNTITGITSGNGGFCLHPAVTYSTTQDTLFLASHLSSGGATYKISNLTGTTASPVLTIGATNTNGLGSWTQPGGNVLPQISGSGQFVDAGDAFIRSRTVYRNGSIYYSQTVGLPAGGFTRTAVQWVKVNTDGTYADGGRIQDPTATSSNGGKWYAHSSIDVNSAGDILLGFSEFSSLQYPSAGYAAKPASSPTMLDPYIYKPGEGLYYKTFSGTRNRWGDYSNTQIDPVNDKFIWTIQEYSMQQTGGISYWGTWWAKVQFGCNAPIGKDTSLTLCSKQASGLVLNVPDATTYEIAAIQANGLSPASGSPATGTGLSANVIADDSWTNNTLSPVTVIYKVLPESGTCKGDTFRVSLVINPAPKFKAFTPSSQAICSGNALSIIRPVLDSSAIYNGVTRSWNRDNLAGIPGAVAASGTGNIAGILNLAVGAYGTQTTNFKIFARSAAGCTSDTTTYPVMVTRAPDAIGATPKTQTIPSGQLIAPISVGFSPALPGATMSWNISASGSVAGTALSDNTLPLEGSLVNYGTSTAMVRWLFRMKYNACFGKADTAFVNVLPPPAAFEAGPSVKTWLDEVVDFNAGKDGNTAILSLKTANVLEFGDYVIEKSTDGIHYEPLARIDEAEAEHIRDGLTIRDERPADGVNFYRLYQPGKAAYSREVALYFGDMVRSIRVWPNPADVEIYMNVVCPEPGAADVSLYDAGMRAVAYRSLTLKEGINVERFSIAHLPAGVFFLRFHSTVPGLDQVVPIVKR